ncbi:MAG: hypothetical protein GWP19_14420 [Planctomycetia bacterium]|nr:hypothetical protein [Planctomycetia bacterium]
MKHLTQIEIDQFVSNLEHNSSNIIDWQDHINECGLCSKRIEEVLSFNTNLSKFLTIDTSPKLKAFIKEIQTANKETCIAYPIPAVSHIPNKSFVIHFADTGAAIQEEHSKYKYLGSLITKNEDLLIRVIKNNMNKNINLYLISDDEKKYQNKLVILSNSNTKYHSDDHGKVKLGKINLPDIETLTVTIKSK